MLKIFVKTSNVCQLKHVVEFLHVPDVIILFLMNGWEWLIEFMSYLLLELAELLLQIGGKIRSWIIILTRSTVLCTQIKIIEKSNLLVIARVNQEAKSVEFFMASKKR